MAKEDTASRVVNLLSPWLESHGLDLYKCEFKKEGPSWVLRVILDKPADSEDEYVSIDECEQAAQYLGELLDEQDFIGRAYNLEVGSPGLDRELLKDSDFVRFAGRLVEVRTYEPINGSREHEGMLVGKDDGKVTIDSGSGPLEFPEAKISRINLAVVF